MKFCLLLQVKDVMKNIMAGLQQTNSEKILLSWVRQSTRNYPQVNVINFTSSWSDGLAFNALLHSHRWENFSLLQWASIKWLVKESLRVVYPLYGQFSCFLCGPLKWPPVCFLWVLWLVSDWMLWWRERVWRFHRAPEYAEVNAFFSGMLLYIPNR